MKPIMLILTILIIAIHIVIAGIIKSLLIKWRNPEFEDEDDSIVIAILWPFLVVAYPLALLFRLSSRLTDKIIKV